MISFRIFLQRAEACGSVNRWYCSNAFGRQIDDEETLMCYYIKSGGAANFAKRFNEAMGKDNSWFCSEFYDRKITDPEILWDYYVNHTQDRNLQNASADMILR